MLPTVKNDTITSVISILKNIQVFKIKVTYTKDYFFNNTKCFLRKDMKRQIAKCHEIWILLTTFARQHVTRV
jgi:hypothetical protein